MSQVVVENLTKVFKGPGGEDVPAVNELNLTVESGELMVLLGPSGCGKTTTLRLIAGLEQPTRGQIKIDGKVVNEVSPKERDVAMVFQNHALYPHMSVRENMGFGLKLRGFSREDIGKRVGEAAEVLGLGDCLARKPEELSGGQHQRVALGRAMVRKPKLFLMDEPLSNLDAPMRAQLRREVAKWHAAAGATMIYVTHEQTEAVALGNRLAVLKAGVVQQVASPMEIYGSPANQFVAGFIGSVPMNFIRGTVSRDGEEIVFQAEGERGFVVKAGNEKMKTLGAAKVPVILGIRAEDIQQASSGGQTMEATVETVEPTGAETHVQARVGGQMIVARMPADFRAAAGEKILLGMDMRKAHFFEAESGRRMN